MRYIQNKIKELKQKISLVDRCLLVYLSFLLVYISIHLFTGAQLQDTNAIDIQNKIKELKQKISLVDRCLLVYLSFLLVYISIHLFTGAQLQDTNAIDVIVRTSTAVIIGYF